MIRLLERGGFVSDQFPAILWALGIFTASSRLSRFTPSLFRDQTKSHLFIHLVLCVLVNRALGHQALFPLFARWSLPVSLLLSILYAVSDEIHQSIVPNRDASVGDLAADAIGALLFLVCVWWKRRPGTPGGSISAGPDGQV